MKVESTYKLFHLMLIWGSQIHLWGKELCLWLFKAPRELESLDFAPVTIILCIYF